MRKLMMRRTGEIACGLILMISGMTSIAKAENSNFQIVNDIKFYIETDKAVYNLGENVEMTYKVTNLRDESVTFNFGHFPVFQFSIEKDNEQIWSVPTVWFEGSSQFTLLPGETREFPDLVEFPPPLIWNMRNNEDELVGLGRYNIIGELYNGFEYDYTKTSVPINIVPEPTTIILLSFGLLPILRQRRSVSNSRHI
jgi:hypothetical protein